MGSLDKMEVQKKLYGKLKDGTPVHSFTLSNSHGMKAVIIEFGAIVRELEVPDKNQDMLDVVLGYEHLDDYQKDKSYFGATVGRVANRMGGAQFSLDRETYQVAANALPDFGNNHLHGGVRGFNKALWTGTEYSRDHEAGVRLKYLSLDGEEGYPGNLKCVIEYSLTENNTLNIEYKASTDKTTLVNLTHHSYFNLSGAGSGDILKHPLHINSEWCTPADEDLIPNGKIINVKGLPFDFTRERSIDFRFDEMQMAKFKGYDLNYVLNHQSKGSLDLAARVRDKTSGIVMEVHTTQPCMHFYTSNFLDGVHGKKSLPYHQYGALCLEPQGFPDAPNHQNFLAVELKPGEQYSQIIRFKFLVSK